MFFHNRTDGGTIETCQDRFSEADLQHSKVTYGSILVEGRYQCHQIYPMTTE